MKTMMACALTIVTLLFGCTSKDRAREAEKLVFDHTYTVIENESDYFSLGKRGFRLNSKAVAHPRPVECRFINFQPVTYPFPQFLEWCHTPSLAEMNRRLKADGKPERTRTGVGFRTDGNIQKIYERLAGEFKSYGISLRHQNFNWKANNKDSLLGWDHIELEKPLIPGINVFVFKNGRPKKKKLSNVDHPNTVNKIIGIIGDFTPAELKRLGNFSSDSVDVPIVSNNHGFHFLTINALKDRSSFLKSKTNKYKAVIVQFKHPAEFKKFAKPDYGFSFYGQRLYGIKTADSSWDILATLNDDFIDEIRKGSHLFPIEETEWHTKIRKIYNSGEMEKAVVEANAFLRSFPDSILAKYNRAVMLGDASYSLRDDDLLKKEYLNTAKVGLEVILASSEFNSQSAYFRKRIRNEYYWFFKKHKQQFKLGLENVASGDLSGHYSASVGASMLALKELREGRKKASETWAGVSLKHFKEFENNYPKWHNINFFSAQALACQGKYREALASFLDIRKKSGNPIAKENLAIFKKTLAEIKLLRSK